MTLPRRLSYEDIAHRDPFMIEVIEFLSSLVRRQELYLVGGYLRDFMLGSTARDADFVTTCDPGTLARETALRFGGKRFTIKEEQDIHRVILHYENRVYTLDFSPIKGQSLEEDLSARDFTINAMALDVWSFALQREAVLPRDLIDKHYGWRDLSRKVLRECHKEAFLSDPVRVLRAMRFQHLLDMEVEERTLNHMKKYASLITGAPGERVAAEVMETLSGPGASAIFAYLQENAILYYIFPALAPPDRAAAELLPPPGCLEAHPPGAGRTGPPAGASRGDVSTPRRDDPGTPAPAPAGDLYPRSHAQAGRSLPRYRQGRDHEPG